MNDLTFQTMADAAAVYEELFVPALFREWAGRVADAARVRPGDRVLDVACGTGVLARTIADRVSPGGSVVGLDVNPGMLSVAARIAPGVEWRESAAESIPFKDGSFNAVVSQFGLMFFSDRQAALLEMVRVLSPGGYFAIAVLNSLDQNPGYAAFATVLERVIGAHAAFEKLVAETGPSLGSFVTPGGAVEFPISAHIVSGTKV